MIRQDGGFLTQADQCSAAWDMLVKCVATPVNCVCMCHGGLSVCSGFYGVHDVAAGTIGANLTGVVDLTARAEGKDVDVEGAISLVMDVTGLMTSE